MVAGVFPNASTGILTPSESYLEKIEEIIDSLWKHEIWTVIDLHQDLLSPSTCGDGFPEWMVNLSNGSFDGSLPMPMPLTLHPGTNRSTQCAVAGPLKFIGWSALYMTDARGKGFQQL